MKNLVLSFSLIIFSIFNSFSQGFDQGSLHGILGIGIGIYGGNNNNQNQDKGEGAAPILVPIELDYAFHDKFSAGLTYQYNSFLTEKDSANAASANNMGAVGYFHFTKKSHSTLYLRFGLGYSWFRYEEDKPNEPAWEVKGGGAWIRPGIGWRKMFGDSPIGFFLNADWTILPYGGFDNQEGIRVKNDNNEDFKITLYGLDLSTGLMVKFK